jgi:hypothetical protein
MKKITLAAGMILAFASCAENTTKESQVATEQPARENRLEKLQWILGEWQMESPDGLFVEKWQQETDTSYIGEGSLTNNKGEVLFSEKLRVEQRGSDVWYIPTIASQNNGQPVLFKEKALAANSVIFENPEHDFPQRIIYEKPSDSILTARIEGKQNGKDAKEEYSFHKKK